MRGVFFFNEGDEVGMKLLKFLENLLILFFNKFLISINYNCFVWKM